MSFPTKKILILLSVNIKFFSKIFFLLLLSYWCQDWLLGNAMGNTGNVVVNTSHLSPSILTCKNQWDWPVLAFHFKNETNICIWVQWTKREEIVHSAHVSSTPYLWEQKSLPGQTVCLSRGGWLSSVSGCMALHCISKVEGQLRAN